MCFCEIVFVLLLGEFCIDGGMEMVSVVLGGMGV